MSMTLVVTRNVSPRVRGFLASTMLELSAGVYSLPRCSPAVRQRIVMVLSEWFPAEHNASIIIVWEDSHAISGQSLVVMGEPPVDLVEIDGLLVTKRPLNTDLRS